MLVGVRITPAEAKRLDVVLKAVGGSRSSYGARALLKALARDEKILDDG